jgi:hypothetical protein
MHRLLPFLLLSLVWTVEPVSPEVQTQAFLTMAGKTRHATCARDAAGNIIFVHLNQMPTMPANTANPQATGLVDGDLEPLRQLPALRGVTIQGQHLGDAGYAPLAACTGLQVARLANLHGFKSWPADRVKPGAGPIQAVAGCRDLRVLDLTHSFGYEQVPRFLHEMPGFPQLHTLIVDVGFADDFAELFPFIQRCPAIERLKLHRCTFSDEQTEAILAALPRLRWFEMKPKGNTPDRRWSHRSLRLIAAHPSIAVLRLIHGDALPLPWEDGLAHLVPASGLTTFIFPTDGGERAPLPADLDRLRQARPDLQINPPYERPNPVDFAWELGPL